MCLFTFVLPILAMNFIVRNQFFSFSQVRSNNFIHFLPIFWRIGWPFSSKMSTHVELFFRVLFNNLRNLAIKFRFCFECLAKKTHWIPYRFNDSKPITLWNIHWTLIITILFFELSLQVTLSITAILFLLFISNKILSSLYIYSV